MRYPGRVPGPERETRPSNQRKPFGFGRSAVARASGASATGPEEKWPLGWYKRYAKDDQAVDIFRYWLEGRGGERVLQNKAWRDYMMANKLLERQIIKKLSEDALHRKSMLDNSGMDEVKGAVRTFSFHANAVEEGTEGRCDTGYKLLHGSHRDVGDFQIEGTFRARKNLQIPDTVTVDYELTFTWNDRIDRKGAFDKVLASIFQDFSDYRPKNYIIRIKWRANAVMNIAPGNIWGTILRDN